ncbi:RWD domain-containing protein 3-like [Ornithodoros turicata]|uniref:RWD domain-containing protein 3-like n=1 Tax=Ornithodoros turicata TaxID=34597 RepID=UPI00313866B8
MDVEDLQAISSVYCGEDEFVLITNDRNCTVFTVKLPAGNTEKISVSATFSVNPRDWNVLFQDAQFSRNSLTHLKTSFNAWRSPEHTVWDGFNWITENAASFLDRPESLARSELQDGCFAVLIQLDHVRDVKRYAKVLRSICDSSGLTARMLFKPQGGPLLVGRARHQEDVKEFLRALKSRNLDVDSKGMPCKEKLSSVLYQGPVQVDEGCFESNVFDVTHCRSFADVESEFKTLGLGYLYSKHVTPELL